MNDAGELRFAVRFRFLAKYLGQLSLVFGALTLVPLAVSLAYGEYHLSFRYGIVVVVSALGGFFSRLEVPRRLQANEGMVIVAACALLGPLVMTIPMTATGMSFLDALFEGISGITTTGLSTLSSVENTSRTFLFSRAWTQWYGGLGIVVVSLALVFQPGSTAKELALTESDPEDLPGSTRAHARRVLLVYGCLTLGAILVIWILGAQLFDAVVYSFAAVSTGGFAAHNDSLAGFGVVLQVAVTLACLLGAVPFTLYRRHRRRGASRSTDTLQVWGLLACCALATVVLGATLRSGTDMSWADTLRNAPLLVFSAQTTAGFSTTSVAELDSGSKLVLIISMLVGGGVGSTAGGFKILRLLVLVRVLQVLVLRTSLPRHAVFGPRLGGRPVGGNEVERALLLVILYPAFAVLSWIPFVWAGYDPLDSLFEVASAVGTAGLSSGVTDTNLPGYLKLVLCADMLVGRLECIAWLVFFYPRTWIGRRRTAS